MGIRKDLSANTAREQLEFQMPSAIRRFWADTSGATAIEYCFIAGLISIVIVAGATAIGTKLNGKFTSVAGGLN